MLKRIALAAVAYVACWIAAHCAVMLSRGDGLSLDYLVSYFRLAWSFSGGDLPSFIWVVSIGFYAVSLAIWFWASRRRAARGI